MTSSSHTSNKIAGNESQVTTTKRRRRFRRDPDFRPDNSRAGRIDVKRRDLDMIAAIAKHRFLNTEQVCRLFACDCPRVERIGQRGGRPASIFVKQHRHNCSCTCGLTSTKHDHAQGCPALFKDDQHVGSRLRELYQAGYLERPINQLQLRVKEGISALGSVPMVYSVTTTGLEVIGEDRRNAIRAGKLSWVNKVNEGTRVFMEHTLATADLSIGVDVALRSRPHLERLTEDLMQSTMSEERRNSVRPYSLRPRYKGEDLPTVCDLAFAIGDKNLRKRWNFLVEIDLGHMPIERADLNRTSIMRKLIGYAKAFDTNLHQTEFGWRGFRVLILTTSEERVRSCVKAAKARFGTASAARIFLFGTLNSHRNLLDITFLDADGHAVRLIEDQATLPLVR